MSGSCFGCGGIWLVVWQALIKSTAPPGLNFNSDSFLPIWTDYLLVKTYVKHIFAGGRTTTPSLKTFDSAFERTRCQLYAHVFLRPQLLQNINCSMLKHVKNSQIDSKMTCLMYDSNFFGVVEVVKRHTRIADTLFL